MKRTSVSAGQLTSILAAIAVIVLASVNVTPAEPVRVPTATYTSSHEQTDRRENGDARADLGSTDPTGRWKATIVDGVLTVTDLHQGTPLLVVENVGGYLAFSPRGDRLVYVHGPEEDGDLRMVSLPPSGGPLELTHGMGPVDIPQFAPDGHRLTFLSAKSGYASLYILDVDHLERPALQLTNKGVTSPDNPRAQPIPTREPIQWDGETIRWTSQDGRSNSTTVRQ